MTHIPPNPPTSDIMYMDHLHDNLDLSSIPLHNTHNLSLFDTYNLEDIEWYTPAPPPPSPHITPNTQPAPSQRPPKHA